MKIIFEDFNYLGYRIPRFEAEIPGVHNLEDVAYDMLNEHVTDSLNDIINWQESFEVDEEA